MWKVFNRVYFYGHKKRENKTIYDENGKMKQVKIKIIKNVIKL